MTLIENINLWTNPNDWTGDTLRDAWQKINDNVNNLNNDKLEDAPIDWEQYARKDLSWTIVEQAATSRTLTFIVTNWFSSWEVIDITNGNGNLGGTSTRTIWDTWAITSLWLSSSWFNADASLKFFNNKTYSLKWTEVIWDSSTTFHFNRDIWIGEYFVIEDWDSVWGWPLWDTTIDWDLTVTWDIIKSGSVIGSVVTYVDDSGWSSTINLPTAVWLLNQAFTYIRTDSSDNTTTMSPSWSETINNVATFTLSWRESVTIISNDSNWFII